MVLNRCQAIIWTNDGLLSLYMYMLHLAPWVQGLVYWCIYPTYLLFLLQKKTVRLICHSPSKIMHTDPLFIDLGILKLNNINHYVLLLFMFRFHTRKLPVIFDDMLTRNYDIHSHDTRQKLHLHVPLPKTNLVKMSVCYTGVTRWNYYTKFIDTYCSLDVYKKRLKMYLHKHQWKCRVSTMFIRLILVTLLITNGCNITVYLLYLSLQPVYPI